MTRAKNYFTALACLILMQAGTQAQELIPVRITQGCEDASLRELIEYNASVLLGAFNQAANEKKKPKLPGGNLMTKETRIKCGELWKTSPMRCTESSLDRPCRLAPSGDYEIRNIPVAMLAAGSEDVQNEEIAISFNSAGLISDVNIVIRAENILAAEIKTEDIVNTNQILDFIEKFRTAYNCKDIEYIEKMYSDDALFINLKTKTVRQAPNSSDMIKSIRVDSKYNYEFQVKTKSEYLTALSRVFKKNKFINVVFNEIEVEPHPGEYDIYGVSIKQHWNSSTYSDVGYLYLLVDCQDKDEMLIFVRAWAPEKVFGFASFTGGIKRFNNSKK
jgi:hypothetical protein